MDAQQITHTTIIDCDVHERPSGMAELYPYLPPGWRSMLQRYPYYGGIDKLMYVNPTGADRADAGHNDGIVAGSSYDLMRRQLLDNFDIGVAILTNVFHPSVSPTQIELMGAFAAAHNDWVAEHWLTKDVRFRGSIEISAQDPAAAVREIDRMAEHPQMIQVALPACPTEWGDPYYHPIYEAAERHGLAVMLHPTGGSRGAIPLPRHYISWHADLSQGFQAQVVSFIFNGVFDKYPNLKVILLEGGWTWLPHLIWRMEQVWKAMRREVPWVKRAPREYFQNNLRFGTQPFEEPDDPADLVKILDIVDGSRLLLFASDYPHWDFDDPNRALPRPFKGALRENVLFRNAIETYGSRLGIEAPRATRDHSGDSDPATAVNV
jgi:uncharacterized protein